MCQKDNSLFVYLRMKKKSGHPPLKAHLHFQVISREWLGRWLEGEDMLEKAAERTATIGEYSCISPFFWFVFVGTSFMYFVCFLACISVLKT